MSLTKQDLQQIDQLLETRLKPIREDIQYVKEKFGSELKEIKDRLDRIERKVNQLHKTEDEDIKMAYKEIESLKKRVKRLELQLKTAS